MKPKAIRSILALVLLVGLLLAVAPVAFADTTIVYDAIPALLPPSMPSQPFQAQQTFEFGDWVQLAGTNRELRTVTVTMVTWAPYSEHSTNPLYQGNSATWSHPITLNIYNFVPGTPLNTKGTLLGTVTQMVTVPWRPVADPTCPTPTAWRFDATNCYNGFAFNITFDMSSLNLTLPNDIIVGLAYNTQSYGVAPIGVTGPYDSLNVGTVGSATVGTDGNTDRVFWNTITASWYTDGGAGGVGIFREDTNWGVYGTVPMQITAAPVPSVVYVNPAWASVPPGQDPDGAGPAIQMGYDAFTTIQAGVDAVASGGTVHVAAGTYNENVDLNKWVALVGAGSGATGSVISATGGSGGVVQLSASGASASQPIQLRSFRIQPTGKAGISVGQFTAATGTNVSFVELYDVQVIGTNTNPCTEQERGLYVDNTSSLTHLKISNSAFDNLHYGCILHKQVSADTSTVQYVDVQNTTFNHNNLKGIYAEKLEDATFKNVTANQNGYDTSIPSSSFGSNFAPWMSGFDINLKAGAYQNLSFINNTITNNGLGGAKEGVGITVKARNDGSTYGPFPATLSNVSIDSSLISGNERGIRIGEPGKSNAGPTGVTVHNACITGNVKTYSGSDGSAYGGLVNASLATVDATNNWWGNASGPAPTGTGDAAVAAPGLVTVSPWNTVGCPLPELSAKTGDALFCVGEPTTVTLDLARIAGLYGYQFEVSYNKDMASAVGAFVNTFFNTTVNAFSDPGWRANCTATPGTCKFSVVKTDPGTPVSGSGTLAQIVFTGVAPGAFDVTVGSDATVTDRDGELLYRILAAPLPLTVCGSTTVSGKVTLQGRSAGNVNPGTITLTDLGGDFLPASTSFSAADGAFTLNVPVMPTGSNYQMDAAHGLYLTNRQTPVALTYGVPLADQNTRLWGGDANNDGRVKVTDLSCIGGSFGATPPGTCTGGSADINADGKVNVQDLAIAGGNFDKCGAQPWDWVHGTPVTTCP